ncbi:unnamed protein product [Trichogramma brassicae]|uniref:Uncharacterized protein n=1 Tax=Trichogramma brassicae TaxID=86971 RepID=A0A6H5I4B9_9HYME|nr:unnamed protein product [Trichogramma brassicae]
MELPSEPVKVGVCLAFSSTMSRAESASRRMTSRGFVSLLPHSVHQALKSPAIMRGLLPWAFPTNVGQQSRKFSVGEPRRSVYAEDVHVVDSGPREKGEGSRWAFLHRQVSTDPEGSLLVGVGYPRVVAAKADIGVAAGIRTLAEQTHRCVSAGLGSVSVLSAPIAELRSVGAYAARGDVVELPTTKAPRGLSALTHTAASSSGRSMTAVCVPAFAFRRDLAASGSRLVVPSWWQRAVQISPLVTHSSRFLISSAVLWLSTLAVAASPRTPSSSVSRADVF